MNNDDIPQYTEDDIRQDQIIYVDCCENCNFCEEEGWKYTCTLLKRQIININRKITDCPYY